MEQVSWLDATTERCCPRCLAVMEEVNLLERTVKMQTQENLATIRWTCRACQFCKISKFNFEGQDESSLVDDHILDGIRQAKAREKQPTRKPQPKTIELKNIQTDAEAMQSAFPDAVSQEDLLHAIHAFFPETMECKDRVVKRTVTPESIKMGERGSMEGYAVSYALGEVEVFSATYYSSDGIPETLEEDAQKAAEALQSLAKGHTVVPIARQPRQFSGLAVRIQKSGRVKVEENSMGFR